MPTDKKQTRKQKKNIMKNNRKNKKSIKKSIRSLKNKQVRKSMKNNKNKIFLKGGVYDSYTHWKETYKKYKKGEPVKSQKSDLRIIIDFIKFLKRNPVLIKNPNLIINFLKTRKNME
jgi:N-acetylglucosamine kinase-like BadF-type ATPase